MHVLLRGFVPEFFRFKIYLNLLNLTNFVSTRIFKFVIQVCFLHWYIVTMPQELLDQENYYCII